MLVGGAGPEFSYQALNQAFGHLQRGARLVAMHRGLYWRTSEGLQLDAGAFLAGLEQAAGTEATVVGKPAPAFFATALARLGASAADTVMVGDDIETDVLVAQRQGLTGVLVKTGKYLPRTHRAAAGTPDHVLDSFADLPTLLEQLSNLRNLQAEPRVRVKALADGVLSLAAVAAVGSQDPGPVAFPRMSIL